ncbi:MAG: hypothetical protein J0H54_09985 [Rhizobiales bacterium]|nr:hypothetical protein [Hyphomicrobiales bacterium]
MLSDSIREMRRTLDDYTHTGLQMAPEAVVAMALVLRSYETEARNMEERLDSVASLHQAVASGGNVVAFGRRP